MVAPFSTRTYQPHTIRHLRKRRFCEFPYVCPEPVLVKLSFLYRNGAKLSSITATGVTPSGPSTMCGRCLAVNSATDPVETLTPSFANFLMVCVPSRSWQTMIVSH